MILGVTGSRHKSAKNLIDRFHDFVMDNKITEFHHGDCTGWDYDTFSVIADIGGIKTIAHPPNINKYRSFSISDVVLTRKPYLDRNKDIVSSVDFLIAAPSGPEELRSGTWSTVRYAKKVGVSGVVWV